MIDEDNRDYQNLLKYEINKLVHTKWGFLSENWNILVNKYNHRTELQEIKNNNIKAVRNVLVNQLGYIPAFYFLNFIYGVSEYPGP